MKIYYENCYENYFSFDVGVLLGFNESSDVKHATAKRTAIWQNK